MLILESKLRSIIRENLLNELDITDSLGPAAGEAGTGGHSYRSAHFSGQSPASKKTGVTFVDAMAAATKKLFWDWDITGARLALDLKTSQLKLRLALSQGDFDSATEEATEIAVMLALVAAVMGFGAGAIKGSLAVNSGVLKALGKTSWTGPLPEESVVRATVAQQEKYRKVLADMIEDAEASGVVDKKTISGMRRTLDDMDSSVQFGRNILANPKRYRAATKKAAATHPDVVAATPRIERTIDKITSNPPGETVTMSLTKKPKPHPPAVPKMIDDVIADEIYLRLSQNVRTFLQNSLQNGTATTRVIGNVHQYQKLGDIYKRGFGIRLSDGLDDRAFRWMYDDVTKRFPDAKSLWPDLNSFKSFIGAVKIQLYPTKLYSKSTGAAKGRSAAMSDSVSEPELTMYGMMDVVDDTTSRILTSTSIGDEVLEPLPSWVYQRLRHEDWTHEFTHHIDKLTGILRAGKTQKSSLPYDQWVHEINARYIAAIEEVERRLIAGDAEMISLIRDGDPLDFSNRLIDIMDAKASGGHYEGIIGLPPEIRAEMIDQILRQGGAHSILRNEILNLARAFPGTVWSVPGASHLALPKSGPYVINPRNESPLRSLVRQILSE